MQRHPLDQLRHRGNEGVGEEIDPLRGEVADVDEEGGIVERLEGAFDESVP